MVRLLLSLDTHQISMKYRICLLAPMLWLSMCSTSFAQNTRLGLTLSSGYKSYFRGFISPVQRGRVGQPLLTNMVGLSYGDKIGKHHFEIELLYADKGVRHLVYNDLQKKYLFSYSSQPSLILPFTYRKKIKNEAIIFGPTVSLAFGGYKYGSAFGQISYRTYSNLFEDRFLFGFSVKSEHTLIEKNRLKLSLEPRIIGDLLSNDGWFAGTLGLKLVRTP